MGKSSALKKNCTDLSFEENCLGRFLKEYGRADKTRAGKMMVAVGKTMGYSGQQRLAIRVPLVRLYQEVETFRQRAIEDTHWTVSATCQFRCFIVEICGIFLC